VKIQKSFKELKHWRTLFLVSDVVML